MKPFLIEVCVNSVESGLAAEQAGAQRIELCDNLQEGGTTPSFGTIKQAKELLKLAVNVLIRPRAGDFLYTPSEMKIILDDIRMAVDLGADGIVCGSLTPTGEINLIQLEQMLEACGSVPFTFHRAFDLVADPFESLKKLQRMEVKRLLTSGLAPKAEEGIPVLKELVKAAGDEIIILPGSGIRAHNIIRIARETEAREFHVSGRNRFPSEMIFQRGGVPMGARADLSEYEHERTDPTIIQAILSNLTKL